MGFFWRKPSNPSMATEVFGPVHLLGLCGYGALFGEQIIQYSSLWLLKSLISVHLGNVEDIAPGNQKRMRISVHCHMGTLKSTTVRLIHHVDFLNVVQFSWWTLTMSTGPQLH